MTLPRGGLCRHAPAREKNLIRESEGDSYPYCGACGCLYGGERKFFTQKRAGLTSVWPGRSESRLQSYRESGGAIVT